MPPHRALVLVALALVVLLAPFPSGPLQLNEHAYRYHRVFVFFSDLPLIALALAMAAGLRLRAHGTRSWMTMGVLALLALLSAALVVHPSLSGAQTVIRAAAAAAIAAAVASLDRREQVFFVSMVAVAAVTQTLLGLGQVVTGAPLGLLSIGEVPDPLIHSGEEPMPRGTMYHPYLLAGLGLIAAGSLVRTSLHKGAIWPWIPLATAAVIPVGLTYSRGALLAFFLGMAFLLPAVRRGSRLHLVAVVALVLGVGIPSLLTLDGWLGRVESSLVRPPDRIVLIQQGIEITASEPVLGVGPARYIDALDELAERAPARVSVLQEPHVVPLLVAAEAGVVAGLLVLALLFVLARRAYLSGLTGLFLFSLFAPFLLLDHFPYTHPQGLVLLGIWAGTIFHLDVGE